MKGSPTCTLGRFCFDSSVNSALAHGGPVDAVAASARSDVNHRVADAGGLGVEHFFLAADAESEGVDERVAS